MAIDNKYPQPPSSQYRFDLDGSGDNAFGAWDDGFQRQDYLKNLLKGFYPGAMNSAFFSSAWGQPRSQQATIDQYNLATPEGARARVSQFGAGAQSRATTSGMQAGNHLASLGFGQSAQGGALLDAQNQARSATTDFANQTTDPMVLASQRKTATMGAGMDPSLNALMQLLGMSQDAPDKPGIWGQILGLGAAAAGAGAFNTTSGSKK